jgi:hypothetical protein
VSQPLSATTAIPFHHLFAGANYPVKKLLAAAATCLISPRSLVRTLRRMVDPVENNINEKEEKNDRTGTDRVAHSLEHAATVPTAHRSHSALALR